MNKVQQESIRVEGRIKYTLSKKISCQCRGDVCLDRLSWREYFASPDPVGVRYISHQLFTLWGVLLWGRTEQILFSLTVWIYLNLMFYLFPRSPYFCCWKFITLKVKKKSHSIWTTYCRSCTDRPLCSQGWVWPSVIQPVVTHSQQSSILPDTEATNTNIMINDLLNQMTALSVFKMGQFANMGDCLKLFIILWKNENVAWQKCLTFCLL